MPQWRANFFDKNGDETRSLVVEAETEDEAMDAACYAADRRDWPSSFRVGDVEELDDAE